MMTFSPTKERTSNFPLGASKQPTKSARNHNLEKVLVATAMRRNVHLHTEGKKQEDKWKEVQGEVFKHALLF